ncbi:MAG: Holliday junction resolvase RuvX [Gammaproteobacteria bacterium]
MSSASPDSTVLGFDYGEKRIGVAVGQTVTRTATALCTLPARAGQPDWVRVQALLDTWRPECVVIGLPGTADGAPHPLAAAIRRFGRRLHGRFGLAVEYVDERLSSHEAAARCAGDPARIDAIAASLILETWLAEHRPEHAA